MADTEGSYHDECSDQHHRPDNDGGNDLEDGEGQREEARDEAFNPTMLALFGNRGGPLSSRGRKIASNASEEASGSKTVVGILNGLGIASIPSSRLGRWTAVK